MPGRAHMHVMQTATIRESLISQSVGLAITLPPGVLTSPPLRGADVTAWPARVLNHSFTVTLLGSSVSQGTDDVGPWNAHSRLSCLLVDAVSGTAT